MKRLKRGRITANRDRKLLKRFRNDLSLNYSCYINNSTKEDKIEKLVSDSFQDSILGDYIYATTGNNTYQFGEGYDVIDYSLLTQDISLVRGGTVNKGSLGTDTFLDFYDKIIATNNSNDWIDGLSDGGFIADLEVNLSKNVLKINNLPGLGSISSSIEKFENISGSNNSDKLIGNSSNNTIIGNQGKDHISGKRGEDNIYGGNGNDVLKGGRGNDRLFGGAGEDLIKGGLGKDILNGGEGYDSFIYKNVKDSRLINKKGINKVDWIQDFNTNEDKIYFSDAKEKGSFMHLGELNYLSAKTINKALREESCLDFNTVCFNITSSNKTFLAINGSELGFQGKNDLLIEITGYTGELEKINISSSEVFINSNLFI